MSVRDPLDDALAAAALTFAARAAASRERAALAAEGAHQDEFRAGQAWKRSRSYADHARKWDDRAREAARGGLLLRPDEEMNDAEFMREFSDIIISCEAAGRCRHARRMLG